MPLIQQLHHHVGTVCQGTYRLLKPEWRITRSGAPYFRGMLRDFSGEIRVYGWAPECQKMAFRHNQPIQCELAPRWYHNELVVDLKRYEQSDWLFAHPFSVVDLEQLPLPFLASELVRFIGSCQMPALREFLMVLFGNESHLVDFLSLPASDDYHHAWPGGLAQHSLEVASRIRSDQSLGQREEHWLTEVAGLVHDIGKLKTMQCQGDRQPMHYVLDHNQLTLEVLAPALAVLDNRWPEGAMALRYLLTWKSSSPQQRPKLPGALALEYADKSSAALDARRKLFQDRPGWQHFVSFNGRGPRTTFWRLSSALEPEAALPSSRA